MLKQGIRMMMKMMTMAMTTTIKQQNNRTSIYYAQAADIKYRVGQKTGPFLKVDNF